MATTSSRRKPSPPFVARLIDLTLLDAMKDDPVALVKRDYRNPHGQRMVKLERIAVTAPSVRRLLEEDPGRIVGIYHVNEGHFAREVLELITQDVHEALAAIERQEASG